MRTQGRSLALLSGLRIRRCPEPWCRPVATAPIQPLAWEAPCAAGEGETKAESNLQGFSSFSAPLSALPGSVMPKVVVLEVCALAWKTDNSNGLPGHAQVRTQAPPRPFVSALRFGQVTKG